MTSNTAYEEISLVKYSCTGATVDTITDFINAHNLADKMSLGSFDSTVVMFMARFLINKYSIKILALLKEQCTECS